MTKWEIDVANLSAGDVLATTAPSPDGRVPIDFHLFCASDRPLEAAARLVITLLDEADGPVDEGFGAMLNRQDSSRSEWEIGASPDGQRFMTELFVTGSVDRVQLRWASNLQNGPTLVRGRLELEEQILSPREMLDLSLRVTSEVSEPRAFLLIPQFLDEQRRPLSPPFEGFASSALHPAYAYLACAPSGRKNQLRIRAPEGARFVSLRLRPWRAAGRFLLADAGPAAQSISQVTADAHDRRAPVFTFEAKPNAAGGIELGLKLVAPESDRRAAILLPTYFAPDGSVLPPPYDAFVASPQFPAFRYLAAAPGGEETELSTAPPTGAAKCAFEVIPWLAQSGLQVSLLADELDTQLDGILLPPEGVTFERAVLSGRLGFRLWALATYDAEMAGTCSHVFLDDAGREIGTSSGRVFFGASRKPPGRLTVVDLPSPGNAARIRLGVQPDSGEIPLRIRIEPQRDGESVA